ncbi:MAG: TEA/ATTS domain family-domain-containing protein [Benjaminiella poitrasii]|nr:MAG: TEA/ATTS domain family-domain-containing protein [Benjaminiella poitrasii]
MIACTPELIYDNNATTNANLTAATLSSSTTVHYHPLQSKSPQQVPTQSHLEKPYHLVSSQQEFNISGPPITAVTPTSHKEEQVWPPDVETAFIKALETIPKLGRRKILVNGKPCGRNELISDFIFRKTGKIRTRKQVSSHIQVLKNTRKADPYFMRLLNDNVDEEGFNVSSQIFQQQYEQELLPHQIKSVKPSKRAPRRRQNKQKPNIIKSISTSSDESSLISSSPSPADFSFEMVFADSQIPPSHSTVDLKDPFYEPFFGCLDFSSDPMANNNMADLAGEHHQIEEHIIGASISMQTLSSMDDISFQPLFPNQQLTDITHAINFVGQHMQHPHYLPKCQSKRQRRVVSSAIIRKRNAPQQRMQRKSFSNNDIHVNMNNVIQEISASSNIFPLPHMSQSASVPVFANSKIWIDPSQYPLWPCYISLYIEFEHPHDPSVTIPHTLAILPECNPVLLPTISASNIDSKLKCPPVSELTQSLPKTTLFSKVNLNLNLNMEDFIFNNTCFFETQDRHTIECTTTIYSFGNIVLEAKEVQQALYLNEGRYIYNFVYVNQFFDAFIKGILSLNSWEEVDVAINNLCVVQVFEDIESKLMQQQKIQHQLQMQAAQDQAITIEAIEGLTLPHSHTLTTLSSADLQEDPTAMTHDPPSSVMSKNTIIPTGVSPLLLMVYEFERGQGTMEINIVDAAINTREFDYLNSSVPTTISSTPTHNTFTPHLSNQVPTPHSALDSPSIRNINSSTHSTSAHSPDSMTPAATATTTSTESITSQ